MASQWLDAKLGADNSKEWLERKSPWHYKQDHGFILVISWIYLAHSQLFKMCLEYLKYLLSLKYLGFFDLTEREHLCVNHANITSRTEALFLRYSSCLELSRYCVLDNRHTIITSWITAFSLATLCKLRYLGLDNLQGVATAHKPHWHFKLFCPLLAIFTKLKSKSK